jgi:hypothetical protein
MQDKKIPSKAVATTLDGTLIDILQSNCMIAKFHRFVNEGLLLWQKGGHYHAILC